MIHGAYPILAKLTQCHQWTPLFWTYQLNFTENLCGCKSKENKLIPSLNTDTPQFSENSTIQSIPTDCTTPQLANIVGKLSTNQDMKKIEA